MRQELITPSLGKRVTNGTNLGLLLMVGGMFCLIRATMGPPVLGLAELAVPFVLLAAHLALAPIPWQWTGDDRPRAGLGRGLIQALAFNLAWVLLLTAILHLWGPEGPRPMGPPPPMRPPGGHGPPGHRWPPGLGLVLMNVAFAAVFGWLFAEKEASEARERSMAGLLRQSRSRALQNQLEPHVLYNALGGISELIHEDPARAEEALVSLAEMYRRLTALGKRGSVTLGEERALVEHYLEVEKIRLGDRLRVSWAWPAALDGRQVPPLLVQPLVENAIKHGLAPRKPGGALRLQVAEEGLGLKFTVANAGEPLDPAWSQGTGLSNLAQRLALLGEGSRLELRRDGEWTLSELFLRPGAPS